MTSERAHYMVVCRLDRTECVLLWYSDDVDGLVTAPAHDGVLRFGRLSDAEQYARDHSLALAKEPSAFFDLDQLEAWLSSPNVSIDCRSFLDYWNFFVDVAASVEQGAEFRALDRAACARTYDKLFYGNNLPAITPEGCSYEPIWSAEEVTEIAALMSAGLRLFRAATVDCHEEQRDRC